jgi:dTDP-4-dehydrorhamnose 3,5-epimerase
MIFTESPLPGAFLIDLERNSDERGFFARAYCAQEFAAKGLGTELNQCSVSYNTRKGTLRGMHYPGFAHGFITLSDDAEVYYMISVPHAPQHAQGFRWNDPAFAIQWPLVPSVISPRDAAYPLLDMPASR